jgi:hypothetical protein
MAAWLRAGARKLWERMRHTTQNIDDSEFKIPWRSWVFAGFFVATLYTIDIPEHARRLGEERERKRLDELGMHNVHKELGDGRYLMRDGSIRKGLDGE